jgi:hypothetical protein
VKPLLALLLLPCAIFAQTVGDSREKVINLLGNPSLSRTTDEKEIWIYTNGTRLTFENGVVTKVSEVAQSTVIVTPTGGGATNAPDPVSPATPMSTARPVSTARPASAANPAYNAWANHANKSSKITLGMAVLIGAACNLLIIIAAFSDGVGWGVAVIFVPFVNLIYIITHWAKVKVPVLIQIFVAIPLLFLGVYLGFH